jgi:hypothetical protein
MRGLLAGLVLGMAALGAAGCNDFHYYDVKVSFNTSSGNFAGTSEISTIQVLVMNVSGADNGSMQIGPNSNGLPSTSSQFGTFEFSTFVDSGTLNFTVIAYDDATSNPACETGRGTATVTASATTTNDVMLQVNKTAVGCVP